MACRHAGLRTLTARNPEASSHPVADAFLLPIGVDGVEFELAVIIVRNQRVALQVFDGSDLVTLQAGHPRQHLHHSTHNRQSRWRRSGLPLLDR